MTKAPRALSSAAAPLARPFAGEGVDTQAGRWVGTRRRLLVLAGTRLLPLPMLGATGRATAADAAGPGQRHPDVLKVQATARDDGRYDFLVTVSSPYDSPQRYADAFRVADERGRVLGERILLHDHAGEQPFTRELLGVQVPAGVRRVRVQARDRVHGYGGAAVVVDLPGR
jgi:hypothetical protein